MNTSVVTKNQNPTARREASSTASTSTVPTITCVSVTGCTPSQRSVSSCTWTMTQPVVSSEASAQPTSASVTRSSGDFFSKAGQSRNVSGNRKSRWTARISRGSHTPA